MKSFKDNKIFEISALIKFVLILILGLSLVNSLVTVPYLVMASIANSHKITSSGTIAVILPLHVEGSSIKDPYGNIVYLRGVNKAQMCDDPDGIWLGSTLWDDSKVAAELDAMKSWGINVMRCHQSVEHWKYNMASPCAALPHREAVKRLLNLAAERGIYVIYDGYSLIDYWHAEGGVGIYQDGLPYPPYQESNNSTGRLEIIGSEAGFVEYWRSVATELKEYPNVIFELWNEPVGPSKGSDPEGYEQAKQSWFNVAQQCIDAIRGEGAQQLIVFQWLMASYANLDASQAYPEVDPSQTLDWIVEANLTDPLGNIVYSTHLYRVYGAFQHPVAGYNAWNYTEIETAFRQMKFDWVINTLEKPLFIGEIGCNMGWKDAGNLEEFNRELEAFENCLKIFNEWGIHYAPFWWRNSGQFRIHSGPPEFIPTESGQIFINATASAT